MTKEFVAYPMKVKPIFIDLIWGGRKLNKYVSLPKKGNVAEIWYMAQGEKYNSVISNGEYKGTILGNVMNKYGKSILGASLAKKYNNVFPLLFKFLDLEDSCSIQVHPDDAYAKKNGEKFGKTEMWHILESFKDSFLYLGMKKRDSASVIKEMIRSNTIEKDLIKYKTKKGESYFVPAGTMHALGKGNLVFEIQQNSDLTFRLYDWGRLRNGKTRELHVEEGLKMLKYKSREKKIGNKFKEVVSSVMLRELVDCEQFGVIEVVAKKQFSYWQDVQKSFVMTVVKGNCIISTSEGKKYTISKGELALFPYEMNKFSVTVERNTQYFTTEIK